MKKRNVLICMAVLVSAMALGGCGGHIREGLSSEGQEETVVKGIDTTMSDSETQRNDSEAQPEDESSTTPVTETISLRIVDGAEEGELILAGETAQEVYTLSADGIAIYLDGKQADASVLEDGMMADIAYSGIVMEQFPSVLHAVKSISVYSLGTKENPGGTMYDLCGLYLQVLNDLWDKDAGLNGNIDYISVDLSEAPGELTQGEKAAIAWIFGGQHEVKALTFTMEELKAEGYLTPVEQGKEFYQWTNGVLFRITENKQDKVYSLPVIKFDAEKWRSPLGAYWFSNCTAVWPQMGTWTQYTVEAELIS